MYACTAYQTLSLTIAQYAEYANTSAEYVAELADQHPSDPYLASLAATTASCHAFATRATRRHHARQWADAAHAHAAHAHAHAATL